MPLGYRMICTVDAEQDVLGLAGEQYRSWLGQPPRGLHVEEIQRGVTVLDGRTRLVLVEHAGRDRSRSLRYRLTEDRESGRWTTTLTLHLDGNPRKPSWTWLDVDAPSETPRDSGPLRDRHVPWTAVPRLARALLAVLPSTDGRAVLGDTPTTATADDVDELIDVVCDPGRRASVLVAGSLPGIPLPAWRETVQEITDQAVGLAAVYVLDAEATQTLRDQIGPSHEAPPGAVRTYLPAADPADVVDARRHRVLGTRTIVDNSPQHLARILGTACRERARTAALPAYVSRVDRLLARVEPEQVLASLPRISRTAEASARTAEASARTAPEDHLMRAREAELERRAEELQSRIEALEDERDLYKLYLDDEKLDHAETRDLLTGERDTLRYLRGETARRGAPEVAWGAVPEEARTRSPGSFQELLDGLGDLRHVVFTGDPAQALDLDTNDPLGTWAAKAWDVLLALNDYAAEHADNGDAHGVHQYLMDVPPGRHVVSAKTHAAVESEYVRNSRRCRASRTFPVPVEVDPQGRQFMESHFKIAQRGLISPRLYYVDDVARTDRVYVRYIGRHPENSKTN